MTAPGSPSWETITVGVALVATMAAYALFAGADFGGGIWDLLAGSSARDRRARDAIDASVTPVWEGNQVWIVLGLVLLWTGFPSAFAAITITLFVPLAASALGLVLRGVGFAFRHEAVHPATKRLTGALFASSSLLAPFFLGAAVGAVATGRIPPRSHGLSTAAWTTPTALVTGALFVAACAFIGAVYLVGDARRRGHEDLVTYFGHRATLSGAVTGVLAAVNLVLLHGSAPYVFGRLTGVALPLVIVSVLAGMAALTLILLRRQWLLRIFGALSVAAVVAAWGLAQYPWLFPTSLGVAAAAAPDASQLAEITVIGMAAVLVVPSFAYLYWLQQHGRLEHDSASPRLRRAARAQNRPATPAAAAPPLRLLTAVIIAVAAIQAVRESRRRRDRAPDGHRGDPRRDCRPLSPGAVPRGAVRPGRHVAGRQTRSGRQILPHGRR
jgi:cytochrome bd ubiquinol oxidase subunit II